MTFRQASAEPSLFGLCRAQETKVALPRFWCKFFSFGVTACCRNGSCCDANCFVSQNRAAGPRGGAGQAPVVPNPRISTHRGGIHVTRMKKELVYDVHTDMMSMPPEGLKEYSVLIVAYPFRKTKTSDFFDGNIRTFEAKHPYFCPKKSDVLHLPGCRLALPLSTKKVFENLLHFLHHGIRCPVFTDGFG